MNAIHFVEYPLQAGRIVTACGTYPVSVEDVTADKEHVTCLRCRGTRRFWTLPLITKSVG